MWKSGKSPRAATENYPQGEGGDFHSFPQALWRKIFQGIIHRLCFNIPQGGVEKEGRVFAKTGETIMLHYRQELMFAVISRMLFCKLVSPFFRAVSTLRMA